MSIVYESSGRAAAPRLPLLAGPPSRVVAWRDGRAVSAGEFLAHAQRVAASLPDASAAVNLCEDRYAFLVAFVALILRGQINLLPPSRAPHAVDEVMAQHAGAYAIGDLALAPAPFGYVRMPTLHESVPAYGEVPAIAADAIVAIGYTSGSTGRPKPNVKTWGAFVASNAGNERMLRKVIGDGFHSVATVPPQHMYGMETSVLMPLLSEVGIHAGRPFFPADVAAALAQLPEPRVLVTTPVHLRALVESGVAFPSLAAFVSATAPMPRELAMAAEARFGAPLYEVFGSTETCVFASRRTSTDDDWLLYEGASLHPQPDGTQVEAPQLAEPIVLADIVTLHDEGRRFRLCGRNTDLLEIAGKRASLGDLNRRLLAIEGVRDGVLFQLDEADNSGIRRIAGLVVAPGLGEQDVLNALRSAVDPVFLPRPLRFVAELPRNETGKLPRGALLALIHPTL
ncbi:xanthomonadin biosynthesis 3-hydroxybenozate--AMP ligase XanA2 [Rothia nasimurium]|uniref:AMP-binding protein n=1 Tax=Luteibacter anthropi TaxID=564369 RepID=A0A7X5U7A6_9GAMM|nr:AMP-binding protein [Luteibacter anthropi]NII05184.1 AMP-binding protein [Luteibacter anthropi]